MSKLKKYAEALTNGPYVSLKTQRDIMEECDAVLREAEEAIGNLLGIADTPIARRKLNIDANEKWVGQARATLTRIRTLLGEKT